MTAKTAIDGTAASLTGLILFLCFLSGQFPLPAKFSDLLSAPIFFYGTNVVSILSLQLSISPASSMMFFKAASSLSI
jgi:hypothetical protein